MTLTIVFDVLLVLCLLAGIAAIVRLNSMVKRLRADKEDMEDVLATLSTTIRQAETTMRTWRLSTQELATTLDPLVEKAELVRDELALLTASGDQIASRLTEVATAAARQTASLAPAVFAQKKQESTRPPQGETPHARHIPNEAPDNTPHKRLMERLRQGSRTSPVAEKQLQASPQDTLASSPRSQTERDLLSLLMQKRREAS